MRSLYWAVLEANPDVSLAQLFIEKGELYVYMIISPPPPPPPSSIHHCIHSYCIIVSLSMYFRGRLSNVHFSGILSFRVVSSCDFGSVCLHGACVCKHTYIPRHK